LFQRQHFETVISCLSKNQANCNKIYNIKINSVQILTKNVNLRIQCINTEILITEMGVSDEAKNVISLKFLGKNKNKNVFPFVNSIRGHTVYHYLFSYYLVDSDI
jgi:hypothetical protein